MIKQLATAELLRAFNKLHIYSLYVELLISYVYVVYYYI